MHCISVLGAVTFFAKKRLEVPRIKKAGGSRDLSVYCWRTAPTARSEASVVREISASRRIWASSVALASAFLILSKAWVIVSFQTKVLVWLVSTSKRGGGGGGASTAQQPE